MATWKYLIRFLGQDGKTYLGSLPEVRNASEIVDSAVTGYASFDDLVQQNGKSCTVRTV